MKKNNQDLTIDELKEMLDYMIETYGFDCGEQHRKSDIEVKLNHYRDNFYAYQKENE